MSSLRDAKNFEGSGAQTMKNIDDYSIVLLHYIYPKSSPKGKLLVLLERSNDDDSFERDVVVVDVARRSIIIDNEKLLPEVTSMIDTLLEQVEGKKLTGAGDLSGGNLSSSDNSLFGNFLTAKNGELILMKKEESGKGEMKTSFVIQSSKKVHFVAVDHLSGGFCTSDGDKSISFWSFSHNCIQSGLAEFIL